MIRPDCDGITNTFSININATGVVSNPVSMTVTHGTQSEVIEVPNEIVSLSIDTGSLLPLNLANAATYSVTGDCDSTITELVFISMIDEDNTTLTGSSSCVSGSFSVELDVSAMRSNSVTISTTQGNHESEDHNIDNNIVPLSFNGLVEEFDSSTASAYTLSGKCDSSLSGDVEVSVIGAVDITDSATCNNDSTFTVDLDGSSLIEPTIIFQATYGEETVSSSSIVNGLLPLRFQSISSGGSHTCALTTNGNVKCWGNGSSGKLGNGSISGVESTPVDVHTSFSDATPLSGITAISSGASHTCALTTDDNVKCWGYGSSGRLGNGSTSGLKSTPVDVHTSSEDASPLSDITAISSGSSHTCVLTTNDNVKCWGLGSSGRLGNGSTSGVESTPVDVHTSFEDTNPLSDIAAINSGSENTCALTINGNVKCWGKGSSGRLGNGSTSGVESTPVDVHTSFEDTNPLSDIAAISLASENACAITTLTTGGNVKCWGKGSYGRLGNGATDESSTPVDVHTSFSDATPLSGITAISSGNSHTCALTTDGNVKCWGRGNYGNLGNGETNGSSTPVDVHTSFSDATPLSGITAISAGASYVCALTTDGNIKCWGNGGNGELGDGEATRSLTPVDILLP